MIAEHTHTAIKPTRIFRFPISPFPWVRVTDKDLVLLRIPDDQIRNQDSLTRKRRILKYYDYKERLNAYAKQKGFVLTAGVAVQFFIPIAARHKIGKRKEMHYTAHLQKPDVSNLLKGFEDALTKKDETINQYAGWGKWWADTLLTSSRAGNTIGDGWIEVHYGLPAYNPKTFLYEQR